jgi:dihydrofolate reductase
MRLSIIVAVGEGGVIGRDGALPWSLPADLARFKRLTMGHHLLVGRKTYEAIGRPLPGRRMVVISRRSDYAPAGVEVAESPAAAVARAAAAGDDEAFVAGGGEVYRQLLPRAHRLYLTQVGGRFAGDTRFPAIAQREWRLTAREDHPADERNPHPYSFLTYERVADS